MWHGPAGAPEQPRRDSRRGARARPPRARRGTRGLATLRTKLPATRGERHAATAAWCAPRDRRDLAAGTQSWRVAPLCGKALAPPATTGSVLICSFFNCTPFLPAPIRSRRGSHVVVRHSAPVVRPRRSSLTAFLVVLCIRPCATLCYDVLGYAMLWYVVLCG